MQRRPVATSRQAGGPRADMRTGGGTTRFVPRPRTGGGGLEASAGLDHWVCTWAGQMCRALGESTPSTTPRLQGSGNGSGSARAAKPLSARSCNMEALREQLVHAERVSRQSYVADRQLAAHVRRPSEPGRLRSEHGASSGATASASDAHNAVAALCHLETRLQPLLQAWGGQPLSARGRNPSAQTTPAATPRSTAGNNAGMGLSHRQLSAQLLAPPNGRDRLTSYSSTGPSSSPRSPSGKPLASGKRPAGVPPLPLAVLLLGSGGGATGSTQNLAAPLAPTALATALAAGPELEGGRLLPPDSAVGPEGLAGLQGVQWRLSRATSLLDRMRSCLERQRQVLQATPEELERSGVLPSDDADDSSDSSEVAEQVPREGSWSPRSPPLPARSQR